MTTPRRALAALALAGALALAPPARAQEAVRDYDPANTDWNGLSQLTELAGNAGLEPFTTDHIDWGTLDPEKDLLVVLYPTIEPDAEQVATWVRAGGRLLVADDFGRCDAVFEAFGVQRLPARGVHAPRWHEENPALPVASSFLDDHPLARDADELVTNHPAMLRVVRGKPDLVYGFGRDEALVVAGSDGDGRYVLLADPSVLINGMLAFDGNLTFAANLAEWLQPDQRGGRVVVLSHGFVLSGRAPEPAHTELGLPGAAAALRDAGRFLRDLDQWLPDEPALRAAGVLLAFALVLAGMALLPLARTQKLDGSWTRAHGGHERVDFEKLVENFDDPRWDGSFVWPAALLREAIEARLVTLSGQPDPLRIPPARLVELVAARRGPAVAARLAEALPRLVALPTREQAAQVYTARVLGRREFERMYDSVRALEKDLAGDDRGPRERR